MARTDVAGPPATELRPDENLTDVLWQRAAAGSDKDILRYWADGGWRALNWSQFAERVRALAGGLIAVGIEPGDRVALMSHTRMEWTIADYAILATGAATVPIYDTSSAEQCAWILADSGAKLAIGETADNAKALDEAREHAPALGEVFAIDDAGLDALAERGGEAEREQVADRASAVHGDDLASIIYTSGTTGNPKGCMLTHRNLQWTAHQGGTVLDQILGDDDATLLFLPLAHSFARFVQVMCLEADVTIGYARSLETLADDLRSFQPTFLLSVPRVFEKVFNTAQRKAQGAKRKVFDFSVTTAAQWSAAVGSGRTPGVGARLRHAVADKLVYAKLRDALGGRCGYCISGGAPLTPHLAHFFHAAGITVLEGYGLTETSAPSTVNNPGDIRIGTVGQPLPGVELKIADDGEILVRGGNVFAGYWQNEDASRETLDADGWMHSGDIGEIDDGGFLSITGRKKELIVTSGGKNVAPALLEERLKAHRLVSQAVVVGDQRPFIAALVTLDADELQAFASERDLSGSGAELASNDAIGAEIDAAVEHANKAVSKAESIRNVAILPRDFTIEDDELTPKMSIRRKVIAEHFADEIESLYHRA